MSALSPGCEIAVPGSTSNLGAGFDAFGLALQTFLVVRVRQIDETRQGELTWSFAGDPPEGENFIERGFRALLGNRAGWPSLHLDVDSSIPMKSGLGSSAAALVAGLRLADLVQGGTTGEQALLDAATALEGHPDNVSASLRGGFTTSASGADDHVISRSIPWPSHWRVVVATPSIGLSTKEARAALPERVSLGDAVANLQRAALMVHAVYAADAAALREALRDRLHQPYRARLVPGLERALAMEAPGLLGTFLSGAGPSIAAIVDDDGQRTVAAFEALYEELQLPAAVRVIAVQQPGEAVSR
jgi:homoserine kinase